MFARTQRLMLRPGWPEDAPALAQAIGHRDVIDKLARAPWPYALGDAEQFLALRGQPTEPIFVVSDSPSDTPRLVGGIGIQPGDRLGEHELGYWFAPHVWGRGYATEAGRQVIEIARQALGIRRLHACHFLDNPASGRVLTKLGFHATGGIEPRFSLGRGGEALSAMYELDLDDDRTCEQLLAA